MDIENNIFKRMIPDYKKLVKYGFVKNDNEYFYKTLILDNLEARIIVCEDILSGKIIDLDFDEEYVNFRIEEQSGNFVGMVREEYIKVLEDIRDKCFIKRPFIGNQANRISKLIFDKYNCEPIFKWENSDNAVFENNGKWFGAVMNVDRSKFSLEAGEVDIIDIKLNPDEILNLLNKKGFYKAYHMNKKSWITITLDETLSDDKIMDLIDESYSYTIKFKGTPNKWVMPVNPSYFDIWAYFDSTDTYYWDEKKNFKEGDIVYLYVTKPVGCIMYKCLVDSFTDDFMVIKKICKYEEGKYNLEILRKYGLTSVRSARHIPIKLSEYFKSEQ